MATTIKSTDLDFQNIKAGLKNYLKSKSEFADYDFDASGLNNILDVLAYNTHINGLTANFALNEAFLPTAQLRSSVVSHAETLGYQVRSRTTANALVGLIVNLSGVSGRPPQIQLPSGWQFTSSIDGVSYTFRTLETFFAKDNGSGLYQFKTTTGSTDIPIYEGIEKTKTFLVGEADERQVFVIPDETIDTSIAHLAGALGKKVWILLPFISDFRWLMNTDRSPWYPNVKLFRQTKFNNWDEILLLLKSELEKI